MPITHQFDYLKPETIGEAIAAAASGRDAVFLAGGTDLVDLIKAGTIRPELVIDLKGLRSLSRITSGDGVVSIGAGVTFSDLLGSDVIKKYLPVVAECARTVASTGIRNRATMAGNICSAVPCMDSGPVLLAYEASVRITGPAGKRSVPVNEFFISNRKTSIGKGEVVTSLDLPVPPVRHAGCWVKLGRYQGEDLAQVSLLVLVLADGSYRIAYGAVGAVPLRARKIEEFMKGKMPGNDVLKAARDLVEEEINPITDVRSTREYRMHMAKVMLERGIRTAHERLNGGGPPYGTSVI